jgi:hypothetical protein
MTTLPKKITLTYTLTVPITFQDFLEFTNKTLLEEGHKVQDELTAQDTLARELWLKFVQTMKGLDKKLPSGRNVDINDEPDHESVHILRGMVNEMLDEAQSSDEEVVEQKEDEPSEIEPNETPL